MRFSVRYVCMNILAIDFGTKRIGLAWAQKGLDIALPFGVISGESQDVMKTQLLELIKNEGINQLVFGLPLSVHEDELENPNTKRIRSFAKEVSDASGLPVAFTDERFSSAEADDMGGEASRDEKSAMIILKAYLDQEDV